MKPDEWKPAGGLSLEPYAHKMVREENANVAVIAGPGAGKTEALAQRADFLLRTGFCPYPHRILAISFKRDASRNLAERVSARCEDRLASRLDSYTFHAFALDLVRRFRPVLVGDEALDRGFKAGDEDVGNSQISFAQMVPRARSIVRRSALVRNAIAATYSHVFLDEFQDCTRSQYGLIVDAFHGTQVCLTAVGDTKQAVMGWVPDAHGEVFESFASDFSAQRVTLYANHRSAPPLRRVQNAMVKRMEPAAAVPDEELVGSEGTVQHRHFLNCEEEARGMAGQIDSWLAAGTKPRDIAVLVVQQPELYAAALTRELQRLGVPLRNDAKLQELFAEPIARLVVDFLRVVASTRAPEALARLQRTLSWLEERPPKSLIGAYLDNPTSAIELRNAVNAFIDRIGPARLACLSSEYEDPTRIADLVESVLREVDAAISKAPSVSEALESIGDERCVRVMTIHKSKGLEFDSVVMLGVETQTYWGKTNERRQLFFVGISRAKRRLVVTTADQRAKPMDAGNRWDDRRTKHQEFLSYLEPELGGA